MSALDDVGGPLPAICGHSVQTRGPAPKTTSRLKPTRIGQPAIVISSPNEN